MGPQFATGLSGWPETAVTSKGSEKERNAFSGMRRTLGQVGASQEGLCAITRDHDGQGARSPAAFRERKKHILSLYLLCFQSHVRILEFIIQSTPVTCLMFWCDYLYFIK